MNQLFERLTHLANFMCLLLRTGRVLRWTLGETTSPRCCSREGDRRSASKEASEGFREWSVPGLVALFREGILEGFWEEVAFQPVLDGDKPLSAKTSEEHPSWL